MKYSNLFFATIIAIVLGLGAAFAGGSSFGDHGGHGGKHRGFSLERMVDKLNHHLDLSDEQQSALAEIASSHEENHKAVRDERNAIHSQIMDLDPTDDNYESQLSVLANEVANQARQKVLDRGAIGKEIALVLTPTQREEVKALMTKRRKNRQSY